MSDKPAEYTTTIDRPLSEAEERRQYFRIKNWIIMNYTPMEDAQLLPDIEDLEFTASPKITLLQELAQVDLENKTYLNSLTDKQSLLGSFLKGINKKVELLTRFVIETLDSEKAELREVDISGGGLRFKSHRPIKIDSHIKLEIVLIPDCYGLVCCARVVDLKPTEVEGIYSVACIFTRLRETDRDAIIRHVFHTQSKQLRHAHHFESKDEIAETLVEKR